MSGNPRGRPKKGKTLTDILEGELRKRNVRVTEENGTTRFISGKQAAARQMVKLAIGGDIAALKYIYDRLDGRPMQAVEHSGSVETSELHVYIPDNGRNDNPHGGDDDA
jgi:hypothetical protein